MLVELVPNSEVFENVYPSDTESDSGDSNDSDEPDTESETQDVKQITDELQELREQSKACHEEKSSLTKRMALLDAFVNKLEKPTEANIPARLEVYRVEREKIQCREKVLSNEETERRDIIRRLGRRKRNLTRIALREAKKKQKQADKAAEKAEERKERERTERHRIRQRRREERQQSWPKKVYRVTLNLDTSNAFTPSSTRRNSVDSTTVKAASPPPTSSSQAETLEPARLVSLNLSYIVKGASWTPRYDLSLSTLKNGAKITYRAEFNNTTSETWKDATTTLSTSQTSFHGLGEAIPTMTPWAIRLLKRSGAKGYPGSDGAFYSNAEMQAKRTQAQTSLFGGKDPKARDAALFGLDQKEAGKKTAVGSMRPPRSQLASKAARKSSTSLYDVEAEVDAEEEQIDYSDEGAEAEECPPEPQPANTGSSARSRARRSEGSGGLFGGLANGFSATPQNLFIPPGDALLARGQALGSFEAPVPPPPKPELAFHESLWEESGLTATYELRGTRTIPPGKTPRCHNIANIDLRNVEFSYTCVPKLRSSAFLKALLTNNSGVTLLSGRAGLTLDGSFLGTIDLPRCSAGEQLTLPLGVDPAIAVEYAKPAFTQNVASGVFNKEDNGVYVRSVTIKNTRAGDKGREVKLLVLDQVPVSRDERLKVEIRVPRGLKAVGDRVKAGERAEDGGKGIKDWGIADAVLKKGGEVQWDVRVKPGCGVKLGLEYETRLPAGEVPSEVQEEGVFRRS